MATTSPFPFPREYSFPPFFTRQTNLTTHHAQLVKWSDLILAYCRHHRIFKLSLGAAIPSASSSALPYSLPNHNDAAAAATAAAAEQPTTFSPATAASSAAAAPEELFHNRALNKRLSLADAREVLDFMRKDGRAEALPASTDVFWIYWRTPDEWAAFVEGWIDETAQKGVVLTLYELTEGETTRGTEFHGLDPDLLAKALQILVKRGKAQIFGQEDSQGVKFF
ncbi:ESCRT-II complex subunit [Colletotrichum caudatum]|nr:ESCRT-II complex subunit [Colletotrichum caudatum]